MHPELLIGGVAAPMTAATPPISSSGCMTCSYAAEPRRLQPRQTRTGPVDNPPRSK
jgi:hypothetical protein